MSCICGSLHLRVSLSFGTKGDLLWGLAIGAQHTDTNIFMYG